jgi:hypothetical protein
LVFIIFLFPIPDSYNTRVQIRLLVLNYLATVLAGISDFNFILAQNHMPAALWCQLCGKLGKAGRKKKEQKKKEERWYPNSRARPPRSGDCDNAWTSSLRKGGTEVDNQVAAPTESSTPNLHRATIAQQRVRMEGWRQRRLGSTEKNLHQGGKRKTDRKRKEKKIDLTLTGQLMEGIGSI